MASPSQRHCGGIAFVDAGRFCRAHEAHERDSHVAQERSDARLVVVVVSRKDAGQHVGIHIIRRVEQADIDERALGFGFDVHGVLLSGGGRGKKGESYN